MRASLGSMMAEAQDPDRALDRRLLRRLRRSMSISLALAGIALLALHLLADGLIERYREAVDRAARLEAAVPLALALAPRAAALTEAPDPTHAMVARGRLASARQTLSSALRQAGASGTPPTVETGLALAARLAEGGSDRDLAMQVRRLRRLAEGAMPAALGDMAAIARAEARALRRRGRIGGLGLGLGALLALWLHWRHVVSPGCRAIERRTLALGRSARNIDRRALHDGLTGLANRRHLVEQLTDKDAEMPLAVLHLDLENFRALNASFGRETGDRVLCYVADTLDGLAIMGETVARMEADAFVLATPRRAHPSQLQELAVEVMRTLERRVTIDGHDLALGAVIGIAARGAGEDAIERLLVNAEIACDRARREGGSVYFSAEMSARLAARRQTAQELAQALMRDRIEPYFQPQIEVATGRVVGFEALARWRQPDGSVLSPYFFMDIAQDARLSQRITAAMLAHSLPALVAWRRAGLDIPRIGLNFTLRELRDPGFHDRLLFDLDRVGLTAHDLAIEILESALIRDDTDPALAQVARLSQSGFGIDLDDFGTGHASLSNLQFLTVDRIKIDRSFIRDLHLKPDLRKVTQAMIDLAKSLGITPLAEGIETEDERRIIAELGCEQMQGFAFGRPMSAERVPLWLVDHAAHQIAGRRIAAA